MFEKSEFKDQYNPQEGKISDFPRPDYIVIFSDAKILKRGIVLDGLRFFVIKADGVVVEFYD